MRVRRKRTNRDGVPLEPSPYGFNSRIRKCAYVRGQEKVVSQALGHPAPFTLLPAPNACVSRKGRAVQLVRWMPQRRRSGG